MRLAPEVLCSLPILDRGTRCIRDRGHDGDCSDDAALWWPIAEPPAPPPAPPARTLAEKLREFFEIRADNCGWLEQPVDWFLEELLQLVRQTRKRRRHRRQLFVFFFRSEGGIPVATTPQILTTSTVGLLLALAESLKGNQVPLSAGPFTVAVDDPNNTITDFPGTPSQSTPDQFVPNGSGNTGTVTVTVTDESQTPPLVGSASFEVVAPPPPVVPDTLAVSFVPATAPPASAAAAAVKKS
jgi:hypothetical protein